MSVELGQVRCLVCGGRGGWWTRGEDAVQRRTRCGHCQGVGWEPDPSPGLVELVRDGQGHDGFTPEVRD